MAASFIKNRLQIMPPKPSSNQEPLLNPPNTKEPLNILQLACQLIIPPLYSVPFAWTAWSIDQWLSNLDDSDGSSPLIIAMRLTNLILCPSVLAVGYWLYAKHMLALVRHEDVQEIDIHLKNYFDINEQIYDGSKKISFSVPVKVTATLLLTLMTGTLGWTKSKTLPLAVKIPWLISYSFIDIIPHINHASYARYALDIFNSSRWPQKIIILGFIAAHAMDDAADFLNTNSTLLQLWFALGILAEIPLTAPEAAIHAVDSHHAPHSHKPRDHDDSHHNGHDHGHHAHEHEHEHAHDEHPHNNGALIIKQKHDIESSQVETHDHKHEHEHEHNHQEPATWKKLLIFAGALYIALCNIFNTLKDQPELAPGWVTLLVSTQTISLLFVYWETTHHLQEEDAHQQDNSPRLN